LINEPLLPGHGQATPLAAYAPPAPAASASQPAFLNKSSHTWSVEERHHAHYTAEGDKPEVPSTSKVAFQGGFDPSSIASTENREQAEHNRDGMQSFDGRMPSNSGRSRTKSLWGQAYDKLDKKLVDEYEKLLKNELRARGAHRKRAKCCRG
jgi:hypothetical protein